MSEEAQSPTTDSSTGSSGPESADGQPPSESAAGAPVSEGDRHSAPGFVLDPQRLLRIAGVTREVLEEARRIHPEPGAVDHLRRVHAQITEELRQALPPPLWKELDELTPDIRDGTLEELALAHAEILGWMEGLFQGTQLAIQAQAAQALDRMRRPLPQEASGGGSDDRDTSYL